MNLEKNILDLPRCIELLQHLFTLFTLFTHLH